LVENQGDSKKNAIARWEEGSSVQPILSKHCAEEEDTAVTIFHEPIMRELPERIARRQMVIELHSDFISFREERKDWDVSRESMNWKAAEIQAG